MKNINEVHGTFTSLADLGAAFGIKSKEPKPKVVKCPNCGGVMTRRGQTNVYGCDFHKLEDKKLGDNEVQVFSPCRNTFIEK